MTDNQTDGGRSRRRVLLGLIVVVLAAFAVFIAAMSRKDAAPPSGGLNADLYAAELAAALADADAAIGAQLSGANDCGLCHLDGDGSAAPLYHGLADSAAERRPPLSAEQYLYESILFPAVHLVEGYTNAMPNNYADRLSQQEIGHLIAYLLTFSADNQDA